LLNTYRFLLFIHCISIFLNFEKFIFLLKLLNINVKKVIIIKNIYIINKNKNRYFTHLMKYNKYYLLLLLLLLLLLFIIIIIVIVIIIIIIIII